MWGRKGFDPNFDGRTIDVTATAAGSGGRVSTSSALTFPGSNGGQLAQRSSGLARTSSAVNNGLRIGKLAGKAVPVIGGVLDYAAGKAEGEDDIRALAGATGSAAGTWGGAAAGAAAGAAIGSVVPVVGTVIGGAVGGILGGMGGGSAGGWVADRIDDAVRGKPQGDRNTSPTTKAGMLIGAVDSLDKEKNNMFGQLGKGLLMAGTGIGAVGAGMGIKNGMDSIGGANEFDQRRQAAQAQLQGAMGQSLGSDIEQGIYVGERAGNFKRGLEQDRMNQEYQNTLGIQGQQLEASQAQDAINAFVQTQNTAAQRAQSILNTRFY
jgi:hypothetical protein